MLQNPQVQISPEVVEHLYSTILVPLHFLARTCAAVRRISQKKWPPTGKAREDLAADLQGSLLAMVENLHKLDRSSGIVIRRLGSDLYGGKSLAHSGQRGLAWGEVAIEILSTASCWLSSLLQWARYPPSKLNEPNPPEVGWQLREVIRIVQTTTMRLPHGLDLLEGRVRRERAALMQHFRVLVPGAPKGLFADASDRHGRAISAGAENEPTKLLAPRGAGHRGPPTAFSGGEMVFFEDRVELCGVNICSGARARTSRSLLELLRVKQRNGGFAAYSGQELAEKLSLKGGQDVVAGAIRSLRDRIIDSLQDEANIQCDRFAVILSRDQGYRLADCITVRDDNEPKANQLDRSAAKDVLDVLNADVRNGSDADVRDVLNSEAAERRTWILGQLAKGRHLRAPDVMHEFTCSLKTAQRDLLALKKEGQIDFVGPRRTGHYHLRRSKPR